MKILGVIHLKGLPGSTSNTKKLDEIIELAQNDVNALSDGGIPVSYTHLTLPTICSV